MNKNYFAALALAALVAIAPRARADQFNFSFNGGGISSSGTLTVSPSSTAGVDEITGISEDYGLQPRLAGRLWATHASGTLL
jgi:hypothetical protein